MPSDAAAPETGAPPRSDDWLDTALFTLLAVAVSLVGFGPLDNNDVGFHVRIGRVILDHGGLPPGVDHLSHTADGAPYLDHEWLAQIAFALLESAAGVTGLVVAQGLLLGAVFALSYRSVSGTVALRSALCCAVLSVAATHFEMRPHLIGWLLTVVFVLLQQAGRKRATVFLLALWANLHGGFVLGVLFAALDALRDFGRTRERVHLGWSLAYVAAPLCNPFGPSIYAFGSTIRHHTDFVGEWQPYAPTSPHLILVASGLLMATRSALRDRSPTKLAQVAVLSVLSVTAMRNGIVALLYLAPDVARELTRLLEAQSRGRRALVTVALAMPAAALSVRAVQHDEAYRFEIARHALPVAATEFINAHRLPLPLFNDYNFGGYLAWKADRRYRLFVDGRLEVYGPTGVLDDYQTVMRWAPGAEDVLRRYDVGTLLIRADRELTTTLVERGEYELVYFDSNAAVLVRRGTVPELRRITNLTPNRLRHRERVDEAIADARYLLEVNPHAFGIYQVLAYQLARTGDYAAARDAMAAFLAERPAGWPESADTRTMLARLAEHGVPVTP